MSQSPPVVPPADKPRPRWPLYLALGVALVLWCALDVQRRGQVDPNRPEAHRSDFTCYTEAGGAFFDGRDPYAVTNPRGWVYVYPPMFALLVSPLYPLDPRWQVTIWFAISVCVVWGLYRECTRLFLFFARGSSKPSDNWDAPRWIGWAALAVALLPLLNSLQRGQVDSLKLYLLVLGVRLSLTGASPRAWFGGGLALVAAVVLKVTPLLPVGFLLFILVARVVSRRSSDAHAVGRATLVTGGVACGAVALLLLVPGAILGWQANLAHLDQFYHRKLLMANDYQGADTSGNTRTIRNQSLSNAIIRLGNYIDYQFLGGPDDRLIDKDWRHPPVTIMDTAGVERVLMAARGVAVLLLLAAGLICVWRDDILGQVATIGLACTAALVVSPISRVSYFTELAPGVLLLSVWLLSRNMTGAARAMAWTPVILVVAHYLLMSFTGRVGLLGIGTTIWYATGLLLVAIGGRIHERQKQAIPAPLGKSVRQRQLLAQ